MSTTFPATLDSFTNPGATDLLNSATVPHATQHANLNDAVAALEAWSIPWFFLKGGFIYCDFAGGNTGDFVSVGVGSGGNLVFNTQDATSWGIATISTGTTTTGRWQLGVNSSGNFQSVIFGVGAMRWSSRSRIGSLSTVTDTFTVRQGYQADAGGGDSNNGAFFRYTNGVNSGKWQAVTRAGSTETATDTGITVDTNFHRFDIIVNAAGTSVGFYIDGTLVATNTTNVPNGNTQGTSVATYITKSAGTTARTLDVDYIYANIILTTAR